ncbi:MAG TPA: hypothetical protein VE525_03465 [Rubrobacter sp.]|jgi:methionyl aminopeptidase|nr:hypothetical protein [Rubrobacter sp.]
MVRWYSALSKASTRWTVVTADEKLSAQYEHTIAVTSNGCEILTPWHLLMRKTADLA